MKIAIEIFVSLFVLIIMVGLCIGVISSDLGVMEARDFYYSSVNELQESNFADDVIASCALEAKKNGYVFDISIRQLENGDRSANITMRYNYRIPLIGVNQEKLIQGYVH